MIQQSQPQSVSALNFKIMTKRLSFKWRYHVPSTDSAFTCVEASLTNYMPTSGLQADTKTDINL